MKAVFLYSEIANYVVACLEQLAKKHTEIHLIRWPLNREAPFEFSISEAVKVYEKSNYERADLQELVNTIDPDVIVCSGWMDKDYLAVVKKFNKSIPTIIALDNHWRGDVKQLIASAISPFWLKRIFSHAWVPGNPQKEFAKKLGFTENCIKTGFYSADVDFFQTIYHQNKEGKENKFPHIFLYVGRYVEHKGIFDMWEAFLELQNDMPNDWELWCLGTGDQFEHRIEHPKIKHFGFVQPADMEQYLATTGVYILPSHFEPWGVSVHEMAAAGYPLLLSDKIGAGEAFLIDQENGYVFESKSVDSIKNAMRKIILTEDSRLIAMGDKSVQLSLNTTPQIWGDKLIEFIDA